MTPTLNARPGLPLAATASNLGPLADLAGTWVGTGFNLISLPDFSSVPPGTGPKDFRLKLNATIETLQVHSDRRSRSEPRRGLCAGQPHRPARHLDLRTNLSAAGQRPGHQRSLHIEPGIWINVPPTTVLPPGTGETVVRMGTIPHGDSILAQSTLILTVPTPSIAPVSSKPVAVDGKQLPSCS
jgi:hypothetical protein